jgi:hypothetical protein
MVFSKKHTTTNNTPITTMTTFLSRPSSGPAPPGYSPHEVELARLDSTSPSVLSAPPPYDEGPPSASSFSPTVHFQIESTGKPWLSLPFAPHPEPIPIFNLHPDDSSFATASQTTPQFTSIRPERCSGSCYLTTISPSSSSSSSPVPVLATTTYRFGPNRPPIIRLFTPHAAPLSRTTLQTLLFSKDPNPNPPNDPTTAWDTFPLTPLGLLTRATTFRTRLGTFEWRYASRRERHALSAQALDGADVHSLLVLERVVRVATARNLPPSNNPHHCSPTTGAAVVDGGTRKRGSKDELIRTRVAQFIRGPAYRTPGSGASTAGNGGRLVLDLGLWEGGRFGDDGDGGGGGGEEESKVDREMAVVMAVATCLVMLKREVDRRRAQQIAIMAGGAGGS